MIPAAALPFPHISPVLLDLPGPFAVRWYGLMYLVGFTIAYFLLLRLARRERLELEPDQVSEVIWAAAIGVLVGGRIGYLLFYNPDAFLHPMEIIRIWEGGLSFHGGLIGTVLMLAWYGRRRGVPFLALGDMAVLAAPLGIMAVRISNFINGELYGRITASEVPWAMRFPSDPVGRTLLGAGGGTPEEVYRAVERAKAAGRWEEIVEQIPYRHPSQLYEAAVEGLLVFLVLWGLVWLARRMEWRLPTGTFGALFLFLYGTGRMLVENYRQPDAQFTGPGDPLGTVLAGLTMGQLLSLGMIVGGVLVAALLLSGRTPRERALPVRRGNAPGSAGRGEEAS
ncbi:MAG: prolipoprotein diacylglyceryl transferase [bacterium]